MLKKLKNYWTALKIALSIVSDVIGVFTPYLSWKYLKLLPVAVLAVCTLAFLCVIDFLTGGSN